MQALERRCWTWVTKKKAFMETEMNRGKQLIFRSYLTKKRTFFFPLPNIFVKAAIFTTGCQICVNLESEISNTPACDRRIIYFPHIKRRAVWHFSTQVSMNLDTFFLQPSNHVQVHSETGWNQGPVIPFLLTRCEVFPAKTKIRRKRN